MRKAIDWLRSGHAYLVTHDHESLARSVMFRTQPEGARLDVVLAPGEHEALKAQLADDAEAMSFLTAHGFPPRGADLVRIGLDDASYDLAISADGVLVNGLRAAPEYDLDIGYGR
jgi:hypothetical protein